MTLLLLLLVLAVIAAVVAVATGAIQGGLADPARGPVGSAEPTGSDGWFRSTDLDQVRFTPALRGYRMDQVDALLDQLRAQLAAVERAADAGQSGAVGEWGTTGLTGPGGDSPEHGP